MGQRTKKLGILLLACFVAVLFSGQASAELKVGVLAKRGAPHAMKQWGATGAYLSEKVGDKVTIIPLKFEAIEPMVKDGKIDFLLANSAFFVEMEKKYNVYPVATLINSREGKALDKFGGVIFTRQDSPIQTLDDIKGKKFMCVDFASFGGAHMAWQVFLENGINPKKDFASFLEGGKHDNVVLAVQNGTVEAGTVRSDTLERMEKEGKIKMGDFKIINQVKDDFPFVHSTPLYPEWPMAALAHIDKATGQKVGAALMAMESGSEAATAAKVVGWAQPADYSSVQKCLKEIKYGVFAGN